MYTIGNIIYGVPLTRKLASEIDRLLLDPEEVGLTMLYRGSGDNTGYCGVKLDRFDECSDVLKISDLNVKPTPEQKKEALEKIFNLPKELTEFLEMTDTYIVWSNS